MKTKLLLSMALVVAISTSAFADLSYIDGPLEHVHLTLLEDGTTVQNDGPSILGPAPGLVYDNIAAGPAGYLAFAPGVGAIGGDDYTSTVGPGFDLLLTEFGFVGGVTGDSTPGGTIDFLIGGEALSVTLAMDGNFIYTITVDPAVTIAASGTFEASVQAGATGQFFLGDGVPVIGSTTVGSFFNGDFDHHFSLTGTPVAAIPEPASIAVLSVLGLGMVSRRRR